MDAILGNESIVELQKHTKYHSLFKGIEWYRRKIVGQILPCIMMSYMCMLTYKGALLQAPPIGFVHADSYHKVHP